jgi:hypothetical protein
MIVCKEASSLERRGLEDEITWGRPLLDLYNEQRLSVETGSSQDA